MEVCWSREERLGRLPTLLASTPGLSLLPYLLFAYREVPQASTGFSPFELLYGRKVRGLLDVLKKAWTGAENQGSGVTQIVEMRQRMEEMMDQVQVNANRAQSRQKRLYDRGARTREFAVGDQVLILLPQTHHSLKLEWVGPYKVTHRVTTVDYEIVMPGRRKERRVYHINLMKKWNPQSTALFAMVAEQEENDYLDDEWFELSDNTEGFSTRSAQEGAGRDARGWSHPTLCEPMGSTHSAGAKERWWAVSVYRLSQAECNSQLRCIPYASNGGDL